MKNLLFLLALISIQLNAQTSNPYGYNDKWNKRQNATDEANIARLKKYLSSIEMFVADDVTEDPSEMYAPYRDDRPKIGGVFKVYMGDTIMLQRSGQFADCLVPHFTLDKKVPFWRYVIKRDKPICKLKASDRQYKPDYINVSHDQDHRIAIFFVSLKKSKETNNYDVCIMKEKWRGFNAACKKNLTKEQFDLKPAFIQLENSPRRAIEYSGKSGKLVKFIYSEFKDRYARDAFTHEFSIDLSEGNVATYKGAVFEVIEATNAEIVYKMIRHFPK